MAPKIKIKILVVVSLYHIKNPTLSTEDYYKAFRRDYGFYVVCVVKLCAIDVGSCRASKRGLSNRFSKRHL